MTAEKKIESLIYDLEKDIEACEVLEKDYRDKGQRDRVLVVMAKIDAYKEILNKIK